LWQADDVSGFENPDGEMTVVFNQRKLPVRPEISGIEADIKKPLLFIPGKHRLNLHAIYGDFRNFVDRDQLEPKHFTSWINGLKKTNEVDFNSTSFSHPKVNSHPGRPKKEIRESD
jgi:L-rhamnose isomerase